MHPLKMKPALKDYLWGGVRLRDEYGKRTEQDAVAESWEISCHPDGRSTVEGGPFAGAALAELLAEHPEWMGTRCAGETEFPLLVKLIDAKQALSLQVHPDDEYARRVEGQQGKNEMWYVVDALPGAELILGFDKPVGREELRRRIGDNTLPEIARRVPVRAGDCYRIPAGMLHAIGAGTLIAEIQQNSNVTYRVCDYGRVDASGRLRELHIDKALDVMDTALQTENSADAPVLKREGCAVSVLADWPYFHTELWRLRGRAALDCGGESFTCLLLAEGAAALRHGGEELPLRAGESAFLPAGLGSCALEGEGRALLTRM